MAKLISKRTAAQTAVLMAVLMLISKLFGFVREMVMAYFYGTNYVVDAYVMSFTILITLFGSIIAALAASYMPVFSRIVEREGALAGDRFTSQIVNLLLLTSCGLATIGFVFSDQIVMLLASGFSGETARLASFFVKVLFFHIIFASLAGIGDAYLQYKGTFLPQIVGGYCISICTIIAIIISARISPYCLAFGVVFGYFFKSMIDFILVRRRGYHHVALLKPSSFARQFFWFALPVFVGSSIQNINLFIDRTLASTLREGSIAALNYASLLNLMIIGVSTTMLSTLVYPRLTQAFTLKQHKRFATMSRQGLYVVMIIAFPCSLGAMIYSREIIGIVYKRGAFGEASAEMTASAFLFYAAGLLFLALNEYLVKIYYSTGNMRWPMYCGMISVIINVTLNLILIRFMQHNGLALATSVAAMVNLVLLYRSAPAGSIQALQNESRRWKMTKIFGATIVAVGSSYPVFWITHYGTNSTMFALTLCVIWAGLLYLLLLWLFKVDEIRWIRSIFIGKIKA